MTISCLRRTLPRRQFLQLAAGAAALPVLSRPVLAQAYPSHPINMVVPFAAGGPSDAVARVLAEAMRGPLGQTLTIENVAGAGGTLGTTRTARAAPDGYTIMVGLWGTHVVNPVIYTLPYDIPTSFEPVGLISTTPHLIAAKQGFPANDLKGLIAWLKANPGKATVGHAGAGSPPHVGAVFFQNATGTSFQLVPYRGAGPAMQDLVAGQIDMLIDSPVTIVPQLKAGKIKAFAIAEKSRLASAPEVPSVDEAGLPGFYFSNWFGLYAPKGTPQPMVSRLNAAMVGALADATVRARFTELGQDVFPREQQTVAAHTALQKADIEKWWPIIKAANIKGE
jgi:tripartite-type tricarboxylate transporter receptor subunit TctC